MRELLRLRDMRCYMVGQGLSLFGSVSLWLAAGIWVKTVTGSYGAAGMTFFCITVGTLAGPLTGVLVDRFSRRRLLVVTNVAGAALLTPLLLVQDADQLWVIYTVLLGYGMLHGLISSGQAALLTGMLPQRLLPDGNAALRTIRESLRLIGPMAGAGLFAWQGFAAVVLLDIAGFLAAAATLLLIRPAEPTLKPGQERFTQAVSAGIRHLWRTPTLRGFAAACAVATSVVGFSESALFAVAEEGLGRSTAFVGVLMTAQGIGAIVGGPVAGTLVNRLGELRVAAAGLALFAAGAAMFLAPYLLMVLAGCVMAGIGLPWWSVAGTTLLQRRTPHDLQGRVHSGHSVVTTVPQTASIAIGAALIELTGFRTLLLATAAVMALAAVLMSQVRRRDATLVAGEPTAPDASAMASFTR